MDKREFALRKGPEAIIQRELINYLKVRDWFVKETHGNMYQSGFPDLWAGHVTWGQRWIEVKNLTNYRFTPAQAIDFPRFAAAGVGIWILTAATDMEYRKLFGPPNWYHFLK